jgi:hypothetical protein
VSVLGGASLVRALHGADHVDHDGDRSQVLVGILRHLAFLSLSAMLLILVRPCGVPKQSICV